MAKGKDYTVTSKEEIRKINEAGDIETWFRIWATSKGGTRFHVEVPETQLDKADEPLTRRAQTLDAI